MLASRPPSQPSAQVLPQWQPRRAPADDLVAMAEALDGLNALIEACKDGEFSLRVGAEQAASAALRRTLLARADEYRDAADRLRAHVLHLGATPEDGGSTAGAMRRGWMVVRSRLAALDDTAILQECERSEEGIRAAFREALLRPLPEPTASLVAALHARARTSQVPLAQMLAAMRQPA